MSKCFIRKKSEISSAISLFCLEIQTEETFSLKNSAILVPVWIIFPGNLSKNKFFLSDKTPGNPKLNFITTKSWLGVNKFAGRMYVSTHWILAQPLAHTPYDMPWALYCDHFDQWFKTKHELCQWISVIDLLTQILLILLSYKFCNKKKML